MARREIVPGTITIFDHVRIKQVEWADPDMDGVVTEPPKRKLFLKHFPKFVPEQKLLSLFNSLCGGHVRNILLGPIYGVITFNIPEAAGLVMEQREKLILDGETIQVEWWKPRKKELSPPVEASQVGGVSGQSPMEELLHLSLVQGWGQPHYSLATSVDCNLQPCYQFSVNFASVPFKVVGLVSPIKQQALINCAVLALQRISRENLLHFIPLHPPAPRMVESGLVNRFLHVPGIGGTEAVWGWDGETVEQVQFEDIRGLQGALSW